MDVPLSILTDHSPKNLIQWRYTWIRLTQSSSCPVVVSTSGRVYDDFVRLFFLHAHREASILVGELPEESYQFRFWWASRLTDLKGSVGVILVKTSTIRVTIPIDLSTRSFIPLPRFFNSRRVPPLLNQSLVLIPQQSALAVHDVRLVESFIGLLYIIVLSPFFC